MKKYLYGLLPQSLKPLVRRFWNAAKEERNRFFYNEWILEPLPHTIPLSEFDCARDDLNEYFQKDAIENERDLLTKTYILQREGYVISRGCPPIALISLCNDSIRLEKMDNFQKREGVRYYSYIPAVKIARLGVHRDFQGSEIGSTVLRMVKMLFLTENRTGCRIITVDAYKDPPEVEKFYTNRGNFTRVPESRQEKKRETWTMYYDLKRTLDDWSH